MTGNVFLSIDKGTDITWAKLDELHYPTNVIKESMRLYPAELSGQTIRTGRYSGWLLHPCQHYCSYWNSRYSSL